MASSDLMAPKEGSGYLPFVEETSITVLKDMNSPENIEMKTDIKNVAAWSALKALAHYLEEGKLIKSAMTIRGYQNNFDIYSVSRNRLGRKESFDVLKHYDTPEYSMKDKLLTDLSK